LFWGQWKGSASEKSFRTIALDILGMCARINPKGKLLIRQHWFAISQKFLFHRETVANLHFTSCCYIVVRILPDFYDPSGISCIHTWGFPEGGTSCLPQQSQSIRTHPLPKKQITLVPLKNFTSMSVSNILTKRRPFTKWKRLPNLVVVILNQYTKLSKLLG